MTNPAKADVVVLIALQEEYDYFSRVFPSQADQDGEYWFEFDDAHQVRRRAVVSVCGTMTNQVMRAKASELLDKVQPSLFVVIGLAGMLASDTRLGETVVATEVHNFNFASRIVDGAEGFDVKWGGQSFHASMPLSGIAQLLRTQHKKLFDGWRRSVLDYLEELLEPADRATLERQKLLPPRYLLHTGPIASGDSVVTSRKYKEKLLDTNRKLVAVDMESAGALAAANDRTAPPMTMVIRAISDPSDERKKAIDEIGGGDAIRQWAMYNAASLLKVFLEELPIWPETEDERDLLEDAHRLSRSHLNAWYRERPSDETMRELGEYLACVTECEDLDIDPTRYWEILAGHIASRNTSYPLRINGEPGTGKTSLLSTLYWHLHGELDKDRTNAPVPIYIDVQNFDELGWDENGKRKVSGEFANAVRDQIKPVTWLIEKGRSIILLVDGLDEDGRFRKAAEAVLFEPDSPSVKKIVSVVRGFSKSGKLPPKLNNPNAILQLSSVRTDSNKAAVLIRNFAAIVDTPPDEITTRLKTLRVDALDLATLSMIHRSLKEKVYRGLTTLSDLYITWFELERASGSVTDLAIAAQMAFDYTFEGRPFSGASRAAMIDWKLIRTHTNVRHCLIAWLIIRCLTDREMKTADRLAVLDRVFVFTINRFCKELLNKNQPEALRGIRALWKDAPLTAKTCLAYLAGRFEEPGPKRDGERLLTQVLKQQPELTADTPRDQLMFVRTCYVSLAKCGNREATRDYVKLMLRHRNLDELNRGFHLEYYGDVPNYEPIVSNDYRDGLTPFPNTRERLMQKLNDALEKGAAESLEIEIHTLSALAQHRHVAVEKLADGERIEILELLRKIAPSKLIATPELRAYVLMVARDLAEEHFTPVTPLERLYDLKVLPRSGWVERKIKRPIESVAAHSFGAYLLGLYFLPDQLPQPGYDKRTVLRMVLLHDFAEAWTGDLLPRQKTPAARQNERRWFEYLSLLSTYDGVADIGGIEQLWEDFEDRRSINGNLAKDLDKLDNLMQLHIYLKSGADLTDAESWKEDLKDDVQTAEGKRILQLITEHFERPRQLDEKSLWRGAKLPIRKTAGVGEEKTTPKRSRRPRKPVAEG